MPVINTDAVLWYNVGLFGEMGYGIPNPSNDVGTLNHSIGDLVTLLGRNLFSIMHHEDVDLRVPPSVNTLRRVHKLYLRSVQVLAGRAIPPGELNMETQHVSPGGEMFRVFPCPYFRVRNHFLKRWAALVMTAMSEAMQHTENRKAIEISTGFAGQIGQYLTRVYTNMAIELFGKTREQALAPGFVLADADFAAYDPSKFFTQTEMVDTVPHLGQVLTEDRLAVLAEGIVVTDLPALQPWPTNLTNWYERELAGASNAVDRQLGEGGAGGETATGGGATAAGMALPPPPGP